MLSQSSPGSGFLSAVLAAVLWIVSIAGLRAVTVSDYAVGITATVQPSPSRITLTWSADSDATGYNVYRRIFPSATEAWGVPISSLAGNATTYVDSTVTAGTRYEYRIVKDGNENGTLYTGHGFITAGIEVPLVESRGKVILVVDDTHAAALSAELERLEQDLIGDGWSVIRHDVARTASVPSVKALIQGDYLADPAGVTSVFLFGHLPVPYSGLIQPDGHSDHLGAWPADLFYGDMNGVYTDVTANNASASRAENRNVPVDGKFDQSTIPPVGGMSRVELQVGRVDLANMPAFAPKTEVDLLRQYLNKDHAYRHKQLTAPARGLIDDHFNVFGGEAFAVNGWRNFIPLLGQSTVANLDWVSTLGTQSYLWAYGTGPGSYTGASGVGNTNDFAANDFRAIFTMLFGSYHGDWDSQNNFLRAPLAGATHGLACAWAGRPHWYFHAMGLGETLGLGAQMTQNNGGSGYPSGSSARNIHIALMGDPTLRMFIIAPPANISGVPNGGDLQLTWNPSPDPVAGYHVYAADAPEGPFARLTPAPVTGTSYSVAGGGAGKTFMIRAVRLETTPSGTFFNQSQGAFYTFGELLVEMTSPPEGAVLPLAPLTLSAVAGDDDSTITKVEFLRGGELIGEDNGAPFELTWSPPIGGMQSLNAKATNADGETRTSEPVNVFIGAHFPPQVIAFDNVFIEPDAAQDGQSGTPTLAEVQDGGATLRLNANCWKRVRLGNPYPITPDTVLQFDFRSTAQGEYHGIALDDDTNSGNAARLFQVYGTQTSGIQTYRNYPGGGVWRTYTIPVSQHYAGTMRYIVFTLDHDAATSIGSSNGSFRNVRLYEKPTIEITASDPAAGELASEPGAFIITRTGPTVAPLEVDITLTDTATNGIDYQMIASKVTIPTGAADVVVPVLPLADTLAEGTETVTCSISPSPAYNNGAGATAAVQLADMPFDAWRVQHFSAAERLQPEVSGQFADPDRDGIPNLQEYGLLLAPKIPDAALLSLPALKPVGSPDHLEISFRRRKAPTDVQYLVEVASDTAAETWDSGIEFTEIVSTTDLGDGTEQVVVRDLSTIPPEAQRFIRIRITR